MVSEPTEQLKLAREENSFSLKKQVEKEERERVEIKRRRFWRHNCLSNLHTLCGVSKKRAPLPSLWYVQAREITLRISLWATDRPKIEGGRELREDDEERKRRGGGRAQKSWSEVPLYVRLCFVRRHISHFALLPFSEILTKIVFLRRAIFRGKSRKRPRPRVRSNFFLL